MVLLRGGLSGAPSPWGSGHDCLLLDECQALNWPLSEEVTLVLKWLTQIRR